MSHFLLYGFVGVVAVLVLFRLLSFVSKRRNRLTPTEVGEAIQKHIDGTEGQWDWDHFTSTGIADPHLDAIRLRCVELDILLPEQRNRELSKIVDDLRNMARS